MVRGSGSIYRQIANIAFQKKKKKMVSAAFTLLNILGL